MYGFTALCTQDIPYAVYASDLNSVWVSCPSEEEVYEKANLLGIANFNDSKLKFFLDELVKIYGSESPPLLISKESDVLFTIEAEVSDNIKWNFQLKLADSSVTAEFFKNTCISGFANHSFLVYKISQLENLIKARDKYTLYLEENYKTVNGTELMQKYKRQHLDDALLLMKYDRDNTNKRIRNLYRRLLSKHLQKGENLIWDKVAISLKDISTWQANTPIESQELLDFKDSVESQSASQDTTTNFGNIPKLESQSQNRVKAKSSTSPKRKRIGMVGRR